MTESNDQTGATNQNSNSKSSDEMLQCGNCQNDENFTVYVTHKVHRKQADGEVETEVLGENVELVNCDECGWVVYLEDFTEDELAELREEGENER